jgi:protein-L-isoaspartate(D-aspartate) O-methyltransferase
MHAHAAESLLPYLRPSKSNQKNRGVRILDIGSGSGYLTHVLAELIQPTSSITASSPEMNGSVVVGLEHIPALRDLGESNMRKSTTGKRFLDSGIVKFVVGDGRRGWMEGKEGDEEDKRWDAIHVGAAAVELHQDLIDQLRCPGRYVLFPSSLAFLPFF